MTKSKLPTVGLTFLTIVLQILSLQAKADDFWASISGDFSRPQVTQYVDIGGNACVPTSILYMLKLGNEPLRSIYQNIPGDTDIKKLQSIIEKGLTLPSTVEREKQKTVYNREFGTHLLDQQTWIENLAQQSGKPAPQLSYRIANRYLDEKVAGRFVRRFHSMILNSIQKSVPVIFAIEVRATNFDDNISDSIFFHSVVLVDVQKLIPKGDLGFMVQYIDPNTGTKKSAMIYEEINTPFNARIWDYSFPGASQWSQGKYGVLNYDNDFISSPYLKIAAPNLMPSKQIDWEERVDSFVTNFTLFTQ